MMIKNIIQKSLMVVLAFSIYACVPEMKVREVNKSVPETYRGNSDSLNSAKMNWKDYFKDEHLIELIDTAIVRNQELNIFFQEMSLLKNEVKARKGEYLPFVDLGLGAGFDKAGRYTRNGALEATTEIEDGKKFPEPLGDFEGGLYASWELDVWKKLRNAKKSAYLNYLASVDGRNFMMTNLIAEVANSYYELLALDNQLAIVNQNIKIQGDALEIVKIQKQSARVTELAVKRFEAQLLDTRALQYQIKQEIIETENLINYLLGRFPQKIERDSGSFNALVPVEIEEGIPSQILENRPDVRQAELELEASKLDVKVARANFYPSFGINANVGLNAYNASRIFATPESLIFSVFGDAMAPVVNRNAIKAMYFNANAKQKQALIKYEQTLLNAYLEVVNQLANIENLQSTFELKSEQVATLNLSIEIANTLFKSARADYIEILLTQEEALNTRFELVEIKMGQLNAMVNIYRALGGGWN